MEIFDINIEVIVQPYAELENGKRKLVETAKAACADSYSPYSNFSVGAALEFGNGVILKANNQENAAYPSGMCAERSLLFYAKANYPHEYIKRMAIAAKNGEKFTKQPVPPCGACRQAILETANRQSQPIELLLAGTEKVFIIKDAKSLLPLQFDAENIK